jgi:hypothetical protein
MKALLSIILSIICLSTSAQTASNSANESLLRVLKIKRTLIDNYELKHRKELITFVKLLGKTKLIRVKNENWPDDTEYIYNILKDTTGKVILTEQIPYSQSGDWYEEFKHYYNTNGSVFAFSKRETVFDDSVKGGVAILSMLRLYDVGSRLIGQSTRLTDIHEKLLRAKKQNFNFRDDQYTIYKNLDDCLNAYHIQL